MRHKQLIAAMLLGVAVTTLGPAACNFGGSDSGIVAQGTEIGIDRAAMDKTVKPGDDFFAFANGAWVRNTEIPADRSSIGGFLVADQKTEKQLEAIVAGLPSNASADSDEGRVRDFYKAYLDTAKIDSLGMTPIKPDLDRFAAITDIAVLSKALGEQVRADVDPLNSTNFRTENLFGLFVTQALAGGEVTPYILQGGLGMPEREYYLSAEPKMASLRGKYRAYIEQVLTLAEVPESAAKAQRIYDLELKIAQAHATRAESEDFANSASEWSRADFGTLGSTGRRSLPERTCPNSNDFPPITPARFPSSPRWLPRSRSKTGKTGWRSTRST
jgi:putative endopeptidase